MAEDTGNLEVLMMVHACARGVWGHAPPGKIFKLGCSEIASEG